MRSILLLLTLAITFASCSNNNTSEKRSESGLTQKDYEAFAQKLDSSMNAGNPAFFSDNLNVPALLDSIAAQRKTKSSQDDKMRKEFETDFKQGITEIGQELAESAKNGGGYKLLRVYSKNNNYHALFRMSSLEGLNYHDLSLGVVDGKVKINDIFVYLTGENISATLGRLIDQGVSKDGELDEAYFTEMQKVQEAKAMVQQGMYQDAYNVLDGLSEQLRKDKSSQLLKLTVAVQLGDDVYLEALKEYEATYPNDPSLNLILLDAFMMKEEYGKAMLCINKLDSTVKDPYLDAYRANIYYFMDDITRAESYMKRTIDKVKDADLATYVALTAIYLEQEKYAEAVGMLRKIQTNFKMTKEEVIQMFVDYESFAGSEEFVGWVNEKS